ncbi:MAG: amidohydrolase family protein [bacterium]|nr:amidohydrolase family protein [bacterium]
MTHNPFRDELRNMIDSIAVVDTHEHIPPEDAARDNRLGFFGFFEHYVSSDLVSAGMPRESLEALRDPANGLSDAERWALMASYWPHVRTTGYGRAMLEYMGDLFGIDDINDSTYAELSKRIRAAQGPGWYRTVLKEKASIACSLVITWPGQSVAVDREFFRAVPILDHYATPATRADLEALETESGMTIQTLDQLMAAQEGTLDRFAGEGIVAVKIFLAYRRTLLFERVPQSDAGRAFDRIWLSQAQDLTFEDLKPLQDFMTRRLIGLATDRGLPVQVHTGLQEGNGNYVENSNPTLLTNVFMEHQDARFDLFHAGWPFSGKVAALAKNFPSVFANLCWVHAISPRIAADTLHDWVETVPGNKIFAVGGDSNYVEGAYGHCKIARRVTVDVLAAKVEEGYLGEDEALTLARRLLRDNAAEFYRLELT